MDVDSAVKLISEQGIFGLGSYDGCLCTHFMVHGISVDVSCRKSSGLGSVYPNFYGIGVRVYSSHMDVDGSGLELVAREVVRQLADKGYDIKVRYCDYECDDARKCVYCGAARSNAVGYLCEPCMQKVTPFGERVAAVYDYRVHEVRTDTARIERYQPTPAENETGAAPFPLP